MEQVDYYLLFRWFVGLGMDDEVWVPTTFTKNCDRLLNGDVARVFFAAVRDEARRRSLMGDEHFMDGTLLPGSQSGLSREKAQQPDASLLDGPGCPPEAQGRRGREALLQRERVDGEPQRADRRRGSGSRLGNGGVGRSPGDPGAAAETLPSPYAGSGQGR